ncbi:MAG: acetyl-CoA carboxylase biotin carboxylase subunit [Actinomycetota bacterium]
MGSQRKIEKILVANRGEIAIRIFRAAKDMGLGSVAIYSDIDRDALHNSFADEAYNVGETAPATSYLNIGKILEIAKRSGVDAIHPGYGFLAENPRFAFAVEEAGLIWIGPPPSAIEMMGDKVSARKAAASQDVQSVPGTLEPIDDPARIARFAAEHGWPVALKAAHGGGGRGFRVVHEESEAAAAFDGAGREAQVAFGNPELYLERYLEEPRHIEVQVLGDHHGNLVHLGERDCSLQRRHQKLIEESPSPVVDADLREQMGAAAVKVAKAAGYYSAGTVEFLLEQTPEGPKFWFLEMNTRLQVEHPVTELVTGMDLAKKMILIAGGEPLGIEQQDVSLRGHAIEMRINAENPARNFLPSPGLIAGYSEPTGPGVRVDSGVIAGSQIPQSYDSLIAKLVCYGADRQEAISRGLRALDEFKIEGLRTTIPFHKLALQSDWFAAGEFSTKTVENDLDLSVLKEQVANGAAADKVFSRTFTVEVEGKRLQAKVTEKKDPSSGKPKPPDLSKASRNTGTGETLTAPMQGTIVKTLVEVGAPVKAGENIIVLEAMKMENMIHCTRDGVLKELKVKQGETVPAGAALAVIEST